MKHITREGINQRIIFILIFIVLLASYFLVPTYAYAEVLDRVVAVVDDEVVTLSELDDAYQKALNYGIDATQEKVLDGLINRILLLRQARRTHRKHVFSARTVEDDNMLINGYIEDRLRAFIRIPHDEIESFYDKNRKFFDEDFYEVRDEIETYLVENELNKRLTKHLEELRRGAYIRIQLKN